ncbi:SDR family NAD(P)-dependent oxidoreductase [Mycobacterium sp. AZCC_0083]|uniref:SDR family NAD(P)-dependent oxidoreductase n=1 Tax=Mycobacterium sp. AZCC_0083 TaxID=2735882 RepID=UPI00161BAF40|nr:glucose 1-dehydrogenase [Mycobacterium sp. AZCC_0083]MBB5167829.1 3alpha(or 20beta)-hydroxysteroid dehydrogenase [Mycobacterium sp. AZCC_0083]
MAVSTDCTRLTDKIAIVSGGTRGIGRAIAERFVAEGALVMVGDVTSPNADGVAKEQLRFETLDVRERESWKRIVARCHAVFGPPNVLVNNAGVMIPSSIADTDGSDYRMSFDVNVLGAVFGIQAVIPAMRERGGGSVIIVSSTASMVGAAGFASYAASKAANMSLAKSAALELGPSAIRVNSLHPGGVETPMSQGPAFDGFDQDAFYARFPIPRIAQPEEIAGAAAFLASDDSGFATGSHLFVDGGQLAGPAL